MTEHYLRFEQELGMHTNAKLEDILQDLGEEDELIITMDSDEVEGSDHIYDVLRNNGFEVLPKGGHDQSQYHIIAQRKKK